MRTTLAIAVLLIPLGCSSLQPPSLVTTSNFDEPDEVTSDDYESRAQIGRSILLWLPNRVFDALDIVRARVRIGPGMAIGVRATELLDINFGAYATAYIGLHGPRGAAKVPWPFGVETFEGLEASVADSTDEEGKYGPRYAPVEFGGGAHIVLAGADVGVDVFEVFDFVLGFLFIDLIGDDF